MAAPVESSETALPTKARILQVAKKRMMHYGIAKTTMNDIADELDMSVGSLYLHYKNKDDIVLALAQSCREEQHEMLQGILSDERLTAPQKLETFIIEKFRFVQAFRTETPHGKELIKYLVQKFPESVDEWETRFESAIASILEQGVEQKAFNVSDVAHQARLIRYATWWFFPLAYLELPVYPTEVQLRELLAWLMASLQSVSR